MTLTEFNTIKKMVKSYMNSLDINECKKELIEKGAFTINNKLSKGNNVNFGLELLPSVLSNVNLCPSAGACKLTCLAFSGVGNVLKSKKMISGKELSAPLKAKARRTLVYLHDREWFLELIKSEINYKNTMNTLLNKNVYFRLNVTSDIEWSELTNELNHINFYDYTKVWTRKSTPNYKLTFSASERTTQKMIKEKVSQGENVAVVFDEHVPSNFLNLNVINGDLTDDRSQDPRGVIVGLKLKTVVGGKDANKFVFKSVA